MSVLIGPTSLKRSVGGLADYFREARLRSALRHVESGPGAQAAAWSSLTMSAGTYGNVADGFDVT
ncbi:MAG: hypothetical protein WB776_12125, partial [Candidatus Sulfotelmatobacter sp.]